MSDCNTIILIQLYGKMQPPNAEPLSVEALAGALAVELPDIVIKVYTLSYLDDNFKLELILKNISDCQPLLIGISIPQSTYELSLNLLDHITKAHPSALIVLGHSLPSYSPEVFLRIYPQVVIVKGWGEESIVELAKQMFCQKNERETIPNLVFLHNGDVKETKVAWQSKFYQPLRISLEDYYIRIEASRGCSYNVCTFCTRPVEAQNITNPWLRRSVEDVISEISSLKSKDILKFTFSDEDFVGSDIDGALKLAHKLQEIDGLKFSLSVRADSIYDSQKSFAENQKSKKLFEVLREAGLELVFVGAESFSKSQLKRFGKGIDPENNLTALAILQALGINYEIGFILFDPLMSKAEVSENILSLDTSGVWSRMGNLLNVLRPQFSSSYVKMLISAELLGGFNINTLSYDYKFLDPVVGLLAEFCSKWEKEIDLIYLLCRNLERTTDSHIIYTKTMFDFRSLFFRLLKASFKLVEEEPSFALPQTTLREFYRERDGIINALYHHLLKLKSLNNTEKDLLLHCQNYISTNDFS